MVRSSFLRRAYGVGTASLIAAASMVTALPGLTQQGPIQLFPERGAPRRAEPAPEQAHPQIPEHTTYRAAQSRPRLSRPESSRSRGWLRLSWMPSV